MKVREGGRIVRSTAIIAVAANHRRAARDRRASASASEAETFLGGLMKRLPRRGPCRA